MDACRDPDLHRIDVHHHLIPDGLRTQLEHRRCMPSAMGSLPVWSAQDSLCMMDEYGIAAAILSCPPLATAADRPGEAQQLARECNQAMAAVIAEHPGRFGGCACLPLPNVEAALEELAYAIDVLGLDGVCLLSNTQGRYLGERGQEPVFMELNRRGLTVLLHPNTPPTRHGHMPLEYLHDITRALACLLASGMLERARNIRWLLAHGGGTLPYISDRVLLCDQVESGLAGGPLPILWRYLQRRRLLRRLSYDTACATSEYVLAALVGFAAPNQLLFGSNVPGSPAPNVSRQLADLAAHQGLGPDALPSIEWRNALRLFPRFADSFRSVDRGGWSDGFV